MVDEESLDWSTRREILLRRGSHLRRKLLRMTNGCRLGLIVDIRGSLRDQIASRHYGLHPNPCPNLLQRAPRAKTHAHTTFRALVLIHNRCRIALLTQSFHGAYPD